MNTGKHRVVGVKPGSVAHETGIEPGDIVETISGCAIVDLLDYMEKTSHDDFEMEILKVNGERWIIDIEKEFDEDLGIIFDERIMDAEKACENKCVFCFVDQLPKNMRPTLYFKDDDWRLSFLMGNYVTLTNVSLNDIERITKERISPLYVSVHSTNPSLRNRMMRSPRAGKILELLDLLKKAAITIHCQVVVCPGFNDGDEFDKTIGDLLSLWPAVQSIAAVPVGLTSHRQNLVDIKPFNAEQAQNLLRQVQKWQKICRSKYHTAVVFAADELYLLADSPLPDFEHYEDFPQLENGVGLISKFVEEFDEAYNEADLTVSDFGHTSIATGVLAYPIIKSLASKISDRFGVKVTVYPVTNRLFGERVTVAGLIVGQDIIDELKGKELGCRVLIPATMLRAEGDLFLDDLTIDDIEKSLSVPVVPVPVNGRELLNAVLKHKE